MFDYIISYKQETVELYTIYHTTLFLYNTCMSMEIVV